MKPGASVTRATKRIRSCTTLSHSLLEPLSQPHLKKSKTLPLKPIYKPPLFNLNDLPDFVLVEILCRLPRESAVQCMCVSKRWFSLVSNPYFLLRFLRLQSDTQKPIPRTLIFTDSNDTRKFFSMSEPMASKTRKFSLSFLPCFQGHPKTDPIVVGAYNDLVLCCGTCRFQRDYYICNPYTKQWDALPPPPQCPEQVRVGFICDDPYYKQCGEDIDLKEERSSTIQLNLEYRYKVVRIIPELEAGTSFQFNMEIFSSETRKWTETVVLSPRSFSFITLPLSAGVVHNRMVYWPSNVDGFIIGLDPYSKNVTTTSSTTGDMNIDHKHCCRFIDGPKDQSGAIIFLGECRGCLRMCEFYGWNDPIGELSVWELKDDQVDGAGNWCLVGRVSLHQLVSRNTLISKWSRRCGQYGAGIRVLAFDPNSDDIVYLQLFEHIVMCNIRARTLTETWTKRHDYFCVNLVQSGSAAFPFVLPWWPTPVTRHRPRPASNSHHVGEEHGGSVKSGAKARDKKQSADLLKRKEGSFSGDQAVLGLLLPEVEESRGGGKVAASRQLRKQLA